MSFVPTTTTTTTAVSGYGRSYRYRLLRVSPALRNQLGFSHDAQAFGAVKTSVADLNLCVGGRPNILTSAQLGRRRAMYGFSYRENGRNHMVFRTNLRRRLTESAVTHGHEPIEFPNILLVVTAHFVQQKRSLGSACS